MHRPGRYWPAVAAAVLAAAACLSAWAQSASGPAPAGLEFRVAPLQADIPVVAKTLSDFLTARGPASAGKGRYKWVPLRDANDPLPTLVTAQYENKTYLLVSTEPNNVLLIGGGSGVIKQASDSHDSLNQPAVSFELDDAGADRFAQLTSTHLNKPLAIIVRGEVVSAPVIRGTLSRRGIIVGRFSQAYAKDVAAALLVANVPDANWQPPASPAASAAPQATSAATSQRGETTSPPTPSAPAATDLPGVRKLLEKRVGGVWKEDIHGSFPPSMHVLRGRIELPPGRLLACYIVFPFGPEDKGRQQILARGYQSKTDARFIGASAQYTVLEISADAAAAAPISRDIRESLELGDFTPPSPESALPQPASTSRPVELPIWPKRHNDEPATRPSGQRVQIGLVKDDLRIAIDLPLSDLSLREPPMMTEADIAAYDANQNSLVLSASGLKALPEPNAVSLHGQGFVVSIDGQRWYMGVLWSPVSTMIPPDLPMSHLGSQAGLIELPVPRPNIAGDKRIRKKLQEIFPPTTRPAK